MSDPAECQPEELLASWLAHNNEATLSLLISQHAAPVVRRIVGFKLAGTSRNDSRAVADLDDVCNEALRNLLTYLNSLKSSRNSAVPRNFNSYVAVTAFNACNEYFRERRPARYRLSNKLRYLLTHSTHFALWESKDGKDVAGLATMRGQEPKTSVPPSQVAQKMARQGGEPRLIDTVQEAFRVAGAPVTFEALLEVVAEFTGLREIQTVTPQPADDGAQKAWEQIPDTNPSAETGLLGRQYIARLWTEICALPLQQRGALLLNLKDSAGGDIQLFDWLGIAGIQQIANALEMDAERFAALWKELPLDDSRVALELGIQRQDVINRRSSARKRLANRMKEFERGK